MKVFKYIGYIIISFALILNYNCSVNKSIRKSPGLPVTEAHLPAKKNVWVFVMAGQSNMAGRGLVEAQDTIPDKRILTLDKENKIVLAKEPLHLYEPTMKGLDCGLSFAKTLLKKMPSNISILMVPTAIGGSSISQWLGDSIHRNVQLLTNFTEKINAAKQYGTVKGIIWHQGESDTSPEKSSLYEQRLKLLIMKFRGIAGNTALLFVAGLLPGFQIYRADKSIKNPGAITVNEAIKNIKEYDRNYSFISASQTQHRGDQLHFNSASLRLMGERYAEEMFRLLNK